jgi:hypothetical protein
MKNIVPVPISLGREQAFPNVGKGGVGVMQVSGAVGEKYGYTKTELARNPNANIDAGTAYLSSFSGSPSAIGQQYNGSAAYGQRIQTQMNNPDYNTNVTVYSLQKLVNSLQSLVKSLKKQQK